MANVDLGRYRRIVQMFWDPAPVNDYTQDQPVWCLGQSYKLSSEKDISPVRIQSTETPPNANSQTDSIDTEPSSAVLVPPANAPETPPESTPSSITSSLAYEDTSQEGRWPQKFVEDFESRFWMTYRSDFETIPKSTDPKATSALSLPMRIKTQLSDQAGFSSDSGWGCMIRSGQSLLANAVAALRLGRDWRRGQMTDQERQIVNLFADDQRAPYSIHSFVRHGSEACGKYPGEWFGPSATARCIE